jgi:membrane carboxypeptidase/penicillin-binding protein
MSRPGPGACAEAGVLAGQFNRAVQARRQPGSSFKLFVYLAALRGGLKPSNTVIDRPISIGDYQPENQLCQRRRL